ncbi:MAG: S-layer homology domain-containing protein, partial [Oscillospiraceae bacterium]|nr:S-layer homology domain-containing protein [Oscillospiraceae bacterium]
MKARKLICMALCIIMLFSLTVPAFAAKPTTATFTDTKGNWAEHEIALVADAGIVGGYPDGSFRPNNNITREQFARVVANFMGYTEEADLSQYTDVNPSDGLTPFVARCVKAGVMGGYSATRMAPKNNITREQAAAMLCRAFKLDTTGLTGNFTDRDSITPGLRAEVAALEMTGLIAGYPDGSFRPKANLNRAQMMAIISRLLPDNEGKIISIISSSGGVTMPCDILDDHSMEFFIPNSVIQAGDINLKILIEKLPPIKGASSTVQAMINKLAQGEINETIKTGASGEFNPKESFPNAFNFNFATVKMSINGKEFTVNSYGREGADGNKVISTPTNFTAADTA